MASAARPSTAPSDVSWKAVWKRRCPRPRGRARAQAHGQGGSSADRYRLFEPAAGRARWTLELLAGEMVSLTEHDSLSRETVRRRLKENDLKPWQKDMWCIPKLDADYVARMEDVLDLYAEAPDPMRPVVCFDESPIQLIGEVRQPIPAAPRQLERIDYEYRRNGTANLFVSVDAHRPWRNVKLTERRTADDFALCMRDLVDLHFPKAEKIRVVLDNLSTHTPAALYAAFPPEEARRLARRHRVPLHAKACQLAQHGRDRDRRAQAAVPRPPHRQPLSPRHRNRRLAAPAQSKRQSHQLDVLNRKGPRQNGPGLSKPHIQRVIITVSRN